MTDQLRFIRDRALSLAYEGARFPEVSRAALSWLYRAAHCARKHGEKELEKTIDAAIRRIVKNNSEAA